jgi:hypothetical protein
VDGRCHTARCHSQNGSSEPPGSTGGLVIQQGPRQFALGGNDKGARALSKEIGPRSSRSETLTFGQISRKRGKAYIGFEGAGKSTRIHHEVVDTVACG